MGQAVAQGKLLQPRSCGCLIDAYQLRLGVVRYSTTESAQLWYGAVLHSCSAGQPVAAPQQLTSHRRPPALPGVVVVVVVVVGSTAVQHSKYSSGESSPVQGSILQGCALGSSTSISCAGGGGRCIVKSLTFRK
jgi:hypothetical protein